MNGQGPAARHHFQIRDARPGDLKAIAKIYAHHVRHGLASFEETPPDPEDMMRRFQAIQGRGLPYLVAECADGEIKGYASAGPYRTRPAYRYSLENTVYIAADSHGQGLGRALLGELIRRCTELGYRQMIAIVGDSENWPSIRLHEALGFKRAGALTAVGFKFGRWVDSVILQRPLGQGDSDPPVSGPQS